MSATTPLPSTYRAVVCHEYGQPLKLDTLPTPEAEPGSAVVQVLAALVDPSEQHRLIQSKRNPHFSQETPFIPGNGAVGRVAALGKDATSMKVGQLVLLEPFLRGRDDPNAQALRAVYEGPSPSAKRLTHQEGLWRDGFWAEYVRAPLESCWPLDEAALLGPVDQGGLGYKISDLPYMMKHAIAYGGFRSIDLKPGETVIVTPATGNHGGAAVQIASAMGARVIAVGRNADTLKKLSENNARVHGVTLTGNVAEDVKILSQFGTIDAFMDFTPATMPSPLHLKSCVAAVKQYGKGVLMGFPYGEFSLPYGMMVGKNITIRAQFMYEASDMRSFVKLAERGLLKLGNGSGVEVIDGYTLEQYDEAVSKAAEQQSWGRQVIFEPFK
ncbi:hypothetical protein UA08_06708 [Talaromyces atroroseus]|uniref:Alcohol dehydrogenase-like C-terminal domain-containing protein n=1 Tax=Talaromyces atroroseus TaxID=1441469 RepID=A0A225AA97_TALAT|nr:hypothetical protein UA08_06708 [Talaromyces atroroseus]OKL57881.1 hypothetical protein UA08_06708 [Talaromyces atroroseus]